MSRKAKASKLPAVEASVEVVITEHPVAQELLDWEAENIAVPEGEAPS
jgi:hypothetical protein